MTVVVRLEGVFAGYGAGDVLKGVDLDIDLGSVTCLIGPNGAGKSTVLKTISGLLRPSRGTVTYDGHEISKLTPRNRLLLGIAHVPQERSLFPAMSVWDNLLMGGYVVKDQKLVRERIDQAVATFPICSRRANDAAGSLSGGEQKQVELARTLVLDPKVILLDEPSIGLEPRSRKLVFASIRALADGGRTVLLVEQNARSGLSAADVGVVLEAGMVRLVMAAPSLLDDPEVARLYLGAAAIPDAHDSQNAAVSPRENQRRTRSR